MISTIIGIILALGSILFIAVLVFGFFLDIKKGKVKVKEVLPAMIFSVIIASALGWGSIAFLSKNETKEEPAKEEVVKKETKEESAKEEVVKKETVTSDKDEEAKAKEKALDEKTKKEQLKEAYLKEIRPKIDNHMKVFDDNWNNIWIPTFDAIANGSTDYYTAYNNLQVIKDNYRGGRNLVVEPIKGMDKAEKKLLNTYESKMGDAFTFRTMAVEVAQEGFNAGEMSPEAINKLQSYFDMAESSMIEAVAAITTIEVGLGIKK